MVSSVSFILVAILYLNYVKTEIRLDKNDLVGIYPPVFSTYYNNDKINVENIPRYAKFLADNGIPGVVVAGTYGEGPLIALKERMLLTDAWMAAGKQYNLQIILQVTGLPFPDALKLAKYAGQKGVNAILALPELYYRPVKVGELVYFIKLLADQAPDTPMIYYDFPGATKVSINMVDFFTNATNLIPNFCGLKTALSIALQVIARTQLQSYQRIFVRTDLELITAYELKANGTISGICNIFPKLCSAIVTAVKSEDFSKARWLQMGLNRRISAISYHDEGEETEIVGRNKAAMEIVTGIPVGEIRKPLIAVPDKTKKAIAEDLMDLGVKIAKKNK